MSITMDATRGLVGDAVRRVVPDADLEHLAPDADLRQTYELDSLDFLAFVEELAGRAHVRIDEEDYPEMRTLASVQEFLTARGAGH